MITQLLFHLSMLIYQCEQFDQNLLKSAFIIIIICTLEAGFILRFIRFKMSCNVKVLPRDGSRLGDMTIYCIL